jgi:Flp pilus assembly protein CpaB
VVGALLVVLAALGAFVAARGTGGGPSHEYVVTAREIPAGTTLKAADLRTTAADLPDELAARAFTDPTLLVGRILTASLATGDLVQASNVVGGDAADPRLQLSIPVERSRALDGLVVAGESVNVLVTYGSGADGATFVVVRGASVLRVDQGQRSGLASSNDIVLLLAVDSPADAIALTHAAQAGSITIVRATAATNDEGPDSYRPPAAKPG